MEVPPAANFKASRMELELSLILEGRGAEEKGGERRKRGRKGRRSRERRGGV